MSDERNKVSFPAILKSVVEAGNERIRVGEMGWHHRRPGSSKQMVGALESTAPWAVVGRDADVLLADVPRWRREVRQEKLGCHWRKSAGA